MKRSPVPFIVMTFRDQMITDASTVFTNADEFGEVIQYTPHGGTAKSVKATVTRQLKDPLSEDGGRVLVKEAEVYIPNDQDNGLTAVNAGYDKLTMAKSVGGPLVDWRVLTVLSHDDGIWHLRVAQ